MPVVKRTNRNSSKENKGMRVEEPSDKSKTTADTRLNRRYIATGRACPNR